MLEMVSLASFIKQVPHQLLSLHNFSCPLRLDFCSLGDNINDSATPTNQPPDFLHNIVCCCSWETFSKEKKLEIR